MKSRVSHFASRVAGLCLSRKFLVATLATLLVVAAVWALLPQSRRLHRVAPPPEFNRAAASALSPERRARLDVEFFNEDYVSHSAGPDYPWAMRAARIRAMAAEGFEVAYLADLLFNYERGGIPTFRSDYRVYWNRVRDLAQAGDASAQCFFAVSVWGLRSFQLDPPTDEDMEILVPRFRQAAAESGHPFCLGAWAHLTHGDDWGRSAGPFTQCARAGSHGCQRALARAYLEGKGPPRNERKALCWLARIEDESADPSELASVRNMRDTVEQRVGRAKLVEMMEQARTQADCEAVELGMDNQTGN